MSQIDGPLDLDTISEIPLLQRVLGPILEARAQREGDRVYMRFGDLSWSFRETNALVRDLSCGLLGLGLAKGERVALFLPNHPYFIFTWWAINLAGGASVPTNPNFTSLLLEYVLEDSDVIGIVTTAALLPVVQQLSERRRRKLRFVTIVEDEVPDALRQGLPSVMSVEDLRQRGRARGGPSEIPLDFQDVHCVSYTSGTTGPSKGAIIPNGQYFYSSCVFLRAVGLNRDDVLFTNLPLFHGLASRLGALPAWMVGAEYVLGTRFSASRFWQEVTECNATVAHTIFTLPNMLMAQSPGPHDRAHRLRAMYNANHDPEFERRFGVRLFEAYGMTEVGLPIYTRYPHRKPGSCGRIHEDWEARIVDERGLDVPIGTPGQIVLRPKLPGIMMKGYVNKSEETARVTQDLWFQTGDWGKQDQDGYFYFTNRHKDRIRRRGENVSPMEVENIILGHPEIADCAALAFPAREGEDDIRVVLVTQPDTTPTPTEIMDWLRGRMPYFMMPRYIEFVPVLPRNPAGKVEKYKLIEAGLPPDTWDREAAGYVIRR